jgi:trans-2,3-dihydro-3-hydroxyanthranilate isomerase
LFDFIPQFIRASFGLLFFLFKAARIMSAYRFFQLDVFTDKAFEGNPLAVFPEGEGLTDEQMQNIAREMNLSETVFVLPSQEEKALRKLRIFTPARELPMAGHPVVGTWNLLARLGIVKEIDKDFTGRVEIYQELDIGVLPVEIEAEWGTPTQVIMTQGKFTPGESSADREFLGELMASLGLSADDLLTDLPVQGMSTGITSLAVPVKSLEVLGRIRVNSDQLAEQYAKLGAMGAYVFTLETKDGGSSRAHARFFAPSDNISEDAATGSACGALASYLVHHGAITERGADGFARFTIEQGDFMKRPSRLHAAVKGEKGNVELTQIGGNSVVILQGDLIL